MSTSDELHRIVCNGADYLIALPHWRTDYIQGRVANTREPYELSMLQDMASQLEPDELVLDVGANIGNHSLYLAAVCQSVVHAFEPNTELCEGLRKSIRANNFEDRITVHQVGVSDVAAFATFKHRDEANLGAQSLAVQYSEGEESIRLVRLDDMGFPQPVRMIKIDVEGMELQVLEGAKNLIQADKPILYIEGQTADDFRNHAQFLEPFGYIYISTFNASPTHAYVHKSNVTSSFELGRYLFESRLKIYAQQATETGLREQLALANRKYSEVTSKERQIKESLENANLKYREVSRQLKQLKDQEHLRWASSFERIHREMAALSESQASVLRSMKSEKQELEQRLHQNDKKYRLAVNQTIPHLEEKVKQLSTHKLALQQSMHDLKSKLDISLDESAALESRRAELEKMLFEQQQITSDANMKYRQLSSTTIPALKAKLDGQTQRSKDLHDRAHKLNERLKAEQQDKASAERELSALRMSKTWKAGQYIRKSSGSFIDAVKLPIRLLRLWRQPKQNYSHIQNEGLARPEATAAAAADGGEEVGYRSSQLSIQSLVDKPNHDIRIACIMDEFTWGAYSPEAHFTQLTPQHWQRELQDCKPELLFIESAWRGKDELWGSKVGHCSTELQDIVSWCNFRGIPTLFWNKEDPVHFETFLNTAKQFDFVFTTDIDCVQRYKAALNHDRVYFLPFACQPRVHNPVEKYQRKDAFCFAGAYYVRYPDRTRDLEDFITELPGYRPVEIYDRNFGKNHPDYQFPENYKPYIVGTLKFNEIDKAYKGYKYAINLNSIKQSQSMFSRRVYELLASNTLAVSNFSRGLRLIFGDLVLTSDSGAEIKRRLQELQDQNATDRLRLAGLRKVMSEHTYADRLNYVLEKITGQSRSIGLPRVHIVAPADSLNEIQNQLGNIGRQEEVALTASLLVAPHLVESAHQMAQDCEIDQQIQVISRKGFQEQSLQQLAGEQHWLAVMHPHDYYGHHYLLDMLLATRYTQAQVIGKAEWFAYQDGVLQRSHSGLTYRPAELLAARRSIVSPKVFLEAPISIWISELDSYSHKSPVQFSVDCYNYCSNLREPTQDVQGLVDDPAYDSGISLKRLIEISEAAKPLGNDTSGSPQLTGRELALWMRGKNEFHVSLTGDSNLSESASEDIQLTRSKGLQTKLVGSALNIQSDLKDGKHEYIYASKPLQIEEFLNQLDRSFGGPVDIHLATEPGLNISLVFLYLDANGARLSHQMVSANRNGRLLIPDGTKKIRLGLRIYAGGTADIKSVTFGHLDLDPGYIMGQSDVLMLTNHYPSYDDLYRNGFVHTRVRGYAAEGLKIDVFRLRKDEPIRWHEFQDVAVTTGSQSALYKLLKSGRYRHVLVHFLDPNMWAVLKDFIDDVRVTVWVHGAEIHPWYRRKYNIHTPDQEAEAKEKSDLRMRFWRQLLQPMPANLHLVFVSNHFASEVMEDLGFELPVEKFSVIHNPIDTDLFNYIEKDPEQRMRILSIRPFASRQYANDLSVQCILELSKRSIFKHLEFMIVGDGVLFEETVAPIRSFPNVHIERKFLSQPEIAQLHKQYGVFLCPTRWDSQGVSRDEAMASGLVPITCKVAAVPEFVSDSCGIMVQPEDAEGLAMKLAELAFDPDLFVDLSKAAASQVRSNRDMHQCTQAEIQCFYKVDSDQ